MKPETVLIRAVKRAIKNGYVNAFRDNQLQDIAASQWNTNGLIYNHDFAKALFGTHVVMDGFDEPLYAWQYHLQRMVIAKNPITYIEKYLSL